MMFGGSPFYSNYDDDDSYFFSPIASNRKYYNERRAMEEEARRRAQLEQYYRQKAQKEEAVARRRQEQLRRLREREREEAAYRQAQAEAIRRRQMKEQSYRDHQLRQMGYYDSNDEEDEDQEPVVVERPSYKIVRGPDGRLYRVQLNDKPKQKSKTKHTTKKEQTAHQDFSAVDEEHEASVAPSSEEGPLATEPMAKPAVPLASVVNPNNPSGKKRLSKNSFSSALEKSAKQDVVLVEDVLSDSEDEDELKSIWRNRRPSPGHWIEPVEEFAGYKTNKKQ